MAALSCSRKPLWALSIGGAIAALRSWWWRPSSIRRKGNSMARDIVSLRLHLRGFVSSMMNDVRASFDSLRCERRLRKCAQAAEACECGTADAGDAAYLQDIWEDVWVQAGPLTCASWMNPPSLPSHLAEMIKDATKISEHSFLPPLFTAPMMCTSRRHHGGEKSKIADHVSTDFVSRDHAF